MSDRRDSPDTAAIHRFRHTATLLPVHLSALEPRHARPSALQPPRSEENISCRAFRPRRLPPRAQQPASSVSCHVLLHFHEKSWRSRLLSRHRSARSAPERILLQRGPHPLPPPPSHARARREVQPYSDSGPSGSSRYIFG